MTINLWYDYIFGHEVCNNLISEEERSIFYKFHLSKGEDLPVDYHKTQLSLNATIPNFLKKSNVGFNLLPSAGINMIFSKNHNWNDPQFLPVEFKWWKSAGIKLNFEQSQFLKHGKHNTEFLIWFPTESISYLNWEEFDKISALYPQHKIRFVHGNLKTPNQAKERPFLIYKSFDYFWWLEQQLSRPKLDINKEASATFSFYNNKYKLHRAVPYYRLMQKNLLQNADCTFHGSVGSGTNPIEVFEDQLKMYDLRENQEISNFNDEYIFYKKDPKFKEWSVKSMISNNYFYSHDSLRDEKLNSLAYLDIVTETNIFDFSDQLFITEKTYRAITRGCIFLILGEPGLLTYLKSKGIQTFDDLFDESYDTTAHWFNRWKIIEKNLDIWLKLGKDGQRDYYRKSFDKLVHNQNIIYNRDFTSDIAELFA